MGDVAEVEEANELGEGEDVDRERLEEAADGRPGESRHCKKGLDMSTEKKEGGLHTLRT